MVETERVLVIRRRYRAIEAWCDVCAEQVVMIKPELTTKLSAQSLRVMFGDIDLATLHCIEESNGVVLICLNSLMKKTEELSDFQKQALPKL